MIGSNDLDNKGDKNYADVGSKIIGLATCIFKKFLRNEAHVNLIGILPRQNLRVEKINLYLENYFMKDYVFHDLSRIINNFGTYFSRDRIHLNRVGKEKLNLIFKKIIGTRPLPGRQPANRLPALHQLQSGFNFPANWSYRSDAVGEKGTKKRPPKRQRQKFGTEFGSFPKKVTVQKVEFPPQTRYTSSEKD